MYILELIKQFIKYIYNDFTLKNPSRMKTSNCDNTYMAQSALQNTKYLNFIASHTKS